MLREIKFRCFEDGKMFYSDSQEDAKILGAKLGSSLMSTFFNQFFCHNNLMQFTGLKDNKRTKEFPNGQDIYEGDVVKRLTDDWEATNLQTLAGEDLKILTKEEVSHIVYRHNGFDVESESFGWEGEDLWDWDKIEIIGNIHDNPELLSKEVPNA